MSTIQADIVAWSAGRPPWQQAVLRELAGGATIDEARLGALLDEIAAAKEKSGPALQEQDLPAATSPAESVSLGAVTDIENVNALVTHQALSFAVSGLTVIYGDNASGKSGFARPIKAAVSSLHQERFTAMSLRPNPTHHRKPRFSTRAALGISIATGPTRWRRSSPRSSSTTRLVETLTSKRSPS